MKNNTNKVDIVKKLSVFLTVASLAGIVLSTLQIYEDVKSTAGTLLVYFPRQWGVFPVTTEPSSMVLGLFVSIVQIIAIAIAFSNMFSLSRRAGAGFIALVSVPFDAWTDIVYRSGYLTGNLAVSTVTTIAFYTFGSEALSAFSWLLFIATWRQAIADISWTIAFTIENVKTIAPEFKRFMAAAERQASKQLEERTSQFGYPESNRYNSNPSRTPTRMPEKSPAYGPVLRPASQVTPTPISRPTPSSLSRSEKPEPTYHPIGFSAGEPVTTTPSSKQSEFAGMFYDEEGEEGDEV